MGRMIMKVAVYCRVSTDSENQLNSLNNQRKYYNDYCTKNGHDLYHVYADEGLTGTNLKREQFLNMLHDAGLSVKRNDQNKITTETSNRKPLFDYIITKDVSRFSRNMRAGEVIDNLVEQGVNILFEQNGIDTSDENYDMYLNLFLNFAQQESIDRSMKVKFGLQQRAIEGKFHFGSDRLYGYYYDLETKKIKLIPEEAEVVKKVFDLYLNHDMGSSMIANVLNSDGLKTQNNKIWTANRIVQILKQEKYTGESPLLKYTYGSVKKQNRNRVLKDKESWIFHDDIFEPIIDKKTFEDAKSIMSKRSKGKRGINTPKNIFSKKLKCARCGKNYIRSNQKQGENTYYFYSCATRRRTKNCDNNSITLLRLESELKPYQDYKLYELLTKEKEFIIKTLKLNIQMIRPKKLMAEKNKDKLIDQIKKKESDIDKLLESFINSSDIVKNTVEKKIEEIQKEKDELQDQLIDFEEGNFDREINRNLELIESINRLVEKKRTFTQEEVLEFISEIVVDGSEINFKFRYEKMLPNADDFKSMNHYFKDHLKGLMSDLDYIKEQLKLH